MPDPSEIAQVFHVPVAPTIHRDEKQKRRREQKEKQPEDEAPPPDPDGGHLVDFLA